MHTIATLGSHSALDICRGAKDEGLSTLVITQKGREKTYSEYYKTRMNRHPHDNIIGCVDECLVLEKFKDILRPDIQKKLKQKNVIFLPHRSFEVYLDFDYHAIEKEFSVPMFGNRFLLKIEERGMRPGQYDLLEVAGIRYPRQFRDPNTIDRLCLVKILEKERKFERAFFLVTNGTAYKSHVKEGIAKGWFRKEQVKKAVIEEFMFGVNVNFHFFYSPLKKRLELLGTDMRRQTNVEALAKIPALFQDEVLSNTVLKFEEAGHVAVTVLESLLEDAFAIGERFVTATKKLFPPGIIGPFSLQTIITPGPPKKDIIVVDISPRMPGSPGITATPYASYLYGKSISVGRRVAMEIKEAMKTDRLEQIIT